ncbi:MAG: NRDE family protein, partial [Rhodospirillales bacterium]|nr:NRDE family protein [Rhodospirillales bacterium]
MCTIVLNFRPGHSWPLLAGANRDEMVNRPWQGPARHWPDRPDCVAGLDVLAKGSWLGVNDEGVMAAMLNRFASLGPAPGKRSRGELVLDALDHAEASEAARALADLDPQAYRPFNMVIGDWKSLYWLRHDGEHLEARPIAPGFHMLTAHELDDRQSPRIAAYLDPFREAPTPDPD